MKQFIISLALLSGSSLLAQQSTIQDTLKEKVPFDGMDMSWQNGSDRRTTPPVLTSKYFVGSIMIDANYTHSFNNPIDNTVVGSTALARNNEIQISSANIGGEFNYEGARGKIMMQFGTRSTVVPRNDYSVYRGQYQLDNVYRYLSEAYAGYHFNTWYGINVDAGMFMSYIGLNSYYQAENWEYQASFTSDNTPWFFNGVRVQIFPTKHLKIEGWLINGWQSYAKFNSMPGLGGNVTWCPNEAVKVLTNDYYGTDAAGLSKRIRFHSDNSLLVRYYNQPTARGISKAAFSSTFDVGFESGDGVGGFNGTADNPSQYFLSGMVYNRVWFNKNKMAWTIGGGYMTNPGRYLVLYPTGDASPLPNPNNPTQTQGTHPFTANPGDEFKGWDCSTNFDFMPNQSITFRVEFVHREASVPYFAGSGGITSPTGYTTTPLPSDWQPDLVKLENRIIFAVLFRI
ncbi:porin [Flavobacterium sp. N1994]|uniref:porin n=1 Tax=Flavobacterium sp. N1994 TaxID=2986827 RepID=UPI002221C2DE|nr:porin [Flavobacterium sp. N1994]